MFEKGSHIFSKKNGLIFLFCFSLLRLQLERKEKMNLDMIQAILPVVQWSYQVSVRLCFDKDYFLRISLNKPLRIDLRTSGKKQKFAGERSVTGSGGGGRRRMKM